MTLGERLKRRAKWARLVLTAGWCFAVIPFATMRPTARVPLIAGLAWLVTVVIITLSVFFLVRITVKCPQCRHQLMRQRAYENATCPNCGLSFTEPIP